MHEPIATQNGNPFITFPEEMWEKILEHVDNTEDILHVFQVFPQLRNLSQRKQFSWLFGEILPFVFPKLLRYWDVKKCRQVSRRWNNAVNTCLLTHPDRLTYSSELTRVPETHFSYCRLPCISSRFSGFRPLHQVVETYRGQNPFPGGHVCIGSNSGYGNYSKRFDSPNSASSSSTRDEDDETLSVTAGALKIVGHHIKHMHFHFGYVSYLDKELLVSQVFVPLFECLSHLPNLKTLRLTDFRLHTESLNPEEMVQISKLTNGPQLPFRLESLSIKYEKSVPKCDAISRDLMQLFANHNNISKHVIQAAYWKECYAEIFPNLTELCLWISSEQELDSVMNDLKCNSIRKLRIYAQQISVSETLDIISPFKIESLQIVGLANEEWTRFSSLTRQQVLPGILPFIRHLELTPTPRLKFSFMKMLPNLEQIVLKMHGQLWDGVYDCQVEDTDHVFRRSLHKFFKEEEYFPDNFQEIWNEMPNLKTLTIRSVFPLFEEAHYFKYTRECPNGHFFNWCLRHDIYDEKEFND